MVRARWSSRRCWPASGSSDRPRAVCPVLAAFVRGYNDALPPELLSDLRIVAGALVDTRSGCDLLRAHRAQQLLAWPRQLRFYYTRPRTTGPGFWHVANAGRRAAYLATRDRDIHRQTVALLERLAVTGRTGERGTASPVVLDARIAPETMLVA
ncbi:hypothetical protein DSM112329_01475 [Paraconexibacter sp. AEG42_29]|uniref:RES domain-containing protein n=1 Tax=Paraconexibacter sp. AEG42_29 TaxID=2997339 RepID=A0AAU7ASL9_9ACTN